MFGGCACQHDPGNRFHVSPSAPSAYGEPISLAVATLIAAGVSAAGGTGMTLMRGRQVKKQQEREAAQQDMDRRAQMSMLTAQVQGARAMQQQQVVAEQARLAHQQRLVQAGAAGIVLLAAVGAAIYVARK